MNRFYNFIAVKKWDYDSPIDRCFQIIFTVIAGFVATCLLWAALFELVVRGAK